MNVNLYNIGNRPLAKAANWTRNFSSLEYLACTVENFSTGADKVLTEQKSDKSFQKLPLQSLCKPPSGIELFRTDNFFVRFWQDFPKTYDIIFWLKQRSKYSPSYSPVEALCCNSKYRTNVIDYFSFGFFLHFSYYNIPAVKISLPF